MTEFLRSLRRAPRPLGRTPAISIASIATLAIALGATTTIFSVFYSVVMRPLPFRDPDGLVQLNARAEDGRLRGVSQVELEDWATQMPSFESVALYGTRCWSARVLRRPCTCWRATRSRFAVRRRNTPA